MKNNKEVIPIFFAVDDGYVPFLAVAMQSLIDNSSNENYYMIKILYTNISDANKKKIRKYKRSNVDIEFVDLTEYIEEIKDKLFTRDYYSKTTYFRLFIPNLYPEYDKVLYLDSDIVLLEDVADLYNIDMEDNLVAAAPDDVIQTIKVFQDYAEKVVGVSSYKNYFNAGVLLMNLDELRKFNFQKKFTYLIDTIRFSVAQDQDYLNRLCKGRVKLIDGNWNRMPIAREKRDDGNIKLIHYNLAYKPWHFEDILYKDYFWDYARKTEFFKTIENIKKNYTDEDRTADLEKDKNLRVLAQKESDCVGDDRLNGGNKLKEQVVPKAKDRLEILSEIEKLEREGKFDVDPEKDPPTIVLMPDKVDYLRTQMTSKIKSKVAYKIGEKFFDGLLRENKVIIKDIIGLENLENIETGAMITCNHFNPFDCFTVEKIFRETQHAKDKKLYKIIREGNYTNFPGLYGFLFRNCNTLPLSSNKRTMVNFMKAVDTILQRGEFILIYPEQSLWWNYRKPKPLKDGAYKLAARNNVPIVPIFITMEDSEIMGDDGFPVQEYIVNIGKPIYPDINLSERENTERMKKINFKYWKDTYENFYKMPLEYTTLNKEAIYE